MHLDLVFPALPPALDGIGDYTACLSRALAQNHHVRVLTAQQEAAPIEGVEVLRAFSLERRRGIMRVVDAIANDTPEWVILQYNQFSYGRWGLNPFVPFMLRRLRKRVPGTRISVMFHEDFVPVTSWKNAIMTIWQRTQFFALGRLADVVGFSIEPWARRYRSWFPAAAVHHVPVGSNIPYVPLTRDEARTEIGIARDAFVPGIFGTLHNSRLLPLIRKAILELRSREENLLVLYVGPDGEALSDLLSDVPVHAAGRQSPEGVARHLAAMDVHLSPFIDGVSTRRGSFMAGLQQGLASVSTNGPLTDDLLREQHEHACLLAPLGDEKAFINAVVTLYEHPHLRDTMGRRARQLFKAHFSWPVIASKWENVLANSFAVTTQGP